MDKGILEPCVGILLAKNIFFRSMTWRRMVKSLRKVVVVVLFFLLLLFHILLPAQK